MAGFLIFSIIGWLLLLVLSAYIMSYIIILITGCIMFSPLWFFYILLLISCIIYAVTPQAIMSVGFVERLIILSGIAALCYVTTLL